MAEGLSAEERQRDRDSARDRLARASEGRQAGKQAGGGHRGAYQQPAVCGTGGGGASCRVEGDEEDEDEQGRGCSVWPGL